VTGGNMEPGRGADGLQPHRGAAGLKETLNEACNLEVAADRAIEVSVLPRDEAYAIPTLLRTATDLLPQDLEVVRLVDIVGLDLQADDAGTHVASTRQIGRMEVVKIENKGRGFRRVRLRVLD
jgi:misacylated tRNA(Ala) deacylase